ncbi:FMR1N protein, partial [Penelope pileata]|nr:FMR1N protein [Penelope pileata]
MLQEGVGTHLAWSYVMLVLLHSIHSSFASPTHVPEKSAVAPGKPGVTLKDVYETVINFFKPVTCRHKGKEALVPCHAGGIINSTECSKNNCCPSKHSHDLKCYVPSKDNLQLAFRLFLLGALGFFILGCLPLFCCACFQRSPRTNPLRRANKKIEEIMRNRRAYGEETDSLL